MIFGSLRHEKTYANLDTDLLKCLNYAKENVLLDFEKGSYEIEGKDIFVNIVGYEKSYRFWTVS